MVVNCPFSHCVTVGHWGPAINDSRAPFII
nr:MAG TPA: hypothetical protein [Caudoviricetes sp.]